ncbi:ABC transporter permease [Nitriliruptoraceae bacterium ZYF776]|nr:ABC transporter permease [Profundirhabdus halotolerans]
MNAALATRTAPPAGRGSSFTGTATLLRFMLRRDRVRIPAWAGGLMVFALYVVTALETVLGDEDLATTAALFSEPVGRLLTGPGYGFDAPNLERFVAGGYGLYFLVLTALMSILLVARHTRVEEQTGRAELVRANVVGRHAVLTATVLTAVLTNLAVAVLVLVTLVAVGGFALSGSLLFAVSIALVGLAFAGVTTITVQLSEYSRAASGLAGAVLGAAFLLRAVGDLPEVGGTALSWVSPLAWGQQTAPFVLDRLWPLLLLVGFGVATTAVGFAVSRRRDLGASIFAVTPGPARAAPALGTPWGLAARLQRGTLLGWTAALAVGGLVFGAYADALSDAASGLPEAFMELFGDEDLIAGYLSFMPVFMAYLAAGFVISTVQGLRAEETGGRMEPVLATPISRARWLAINVAVAAAGAVVVLVAAGVAAGVGAGIVTGDAGHLGEQALAHLNHLPAVLVVLGAAALLFGVLPQAVPITWIFVIYGVFAGTFGPMLDLPQAAANLSPFEHAAEVPLEAFTATPLVVLAVVAVVAASAGVARFRRRDLHTT